MRWQPHNKFESEFKAIGKRNRKLDQGFEEAKRLLAAQFHPSQPIQVINPGKIHHLHSYADFELWKLEMMVDLLRPSQFPRVWFALQPGVISFLAIRSHTDNYNDDTVTRQAKERFAELQSTIDKPSDDSAEDHRASER